MESSYDKEADAMYIKLRDGDFSKNRKIDDHTILDLDKDENILGIELLNVSENLPAKSLSEIHVKNLTAVMS